MKSEYKKNKYKILRKAITPEIAKFCYSYFLNKRRVSNYLFAKKWLSPFATEWGIWNDGMIPGTYTHYADLVMETLLMGLRPKMEKESGYKLHETYSYARLYKRGDILHRHKDRYSCEVSTTLNLGGDPWPIYLEPSGKEGRAGIKVDLAPGDMLMYAGCDLEHWRDPFAGERCAQVFLHYNDAKKKTAKANKYDGRPMLGLPGGFKGAPPLTLKEKKDI